MFKVVCFIFVAIIVLGLIFVAFQVFNFIYEVPRQLKRIADALEERVTHDYQR